MSRYIKLDPGIKEQGFLGGEWGTDIKSVIVWNKNRKGVSWL